MSQEIQIADTSNNKSNNNNGNGSTRGANAGTGGINGNNAIRRADFENIKAYLWWSATWIIIIGIIMIGFIAAYSHTQWFVAFGSGVLIAGAALLAGAFMGFIFGIPSIIQDSTARIKYNDNLVQISDWLTKIIVGVGLTQLYQLPHYIRILGERFQNNFDDSAWGRNVAIAIMLYYFIMGFIIIYFWTRTDYSTVMKYIDNDLLETALAKVDFLKKELVTVEKKQR